MERTFSFPPKPQLTSSVSPPPVPVPLPTQPDRPPMAAAMTTAELQAAIAALPAKKQRLRVAFDRLVACSPVPIPFRWDDLDAHISSLQSSIDVRFSRLQYLQVAVSPTTANPVEHPEEEVRDPYVEHHARDKDRECNEEEGERAEIKTEEDSDRVEETIKASPDQKDDEEEEAIEESLWHEQEGKSENAKEAMKASAYQRNEEAKCPIPGFTGGGGPEAAVWRDLAAACANMDASTLADMLCWGGRRCLRARRQFPLALLGAAEPHALVVRAVKDFLPRTEAKKEKQWENCVALLNCIPKLTAEPSVDTLEQASRLAEDWKEMIGKPESCRDLGRLAIWGLFSFLVSFNIILEFDANEIIHLYGNIPRSKKQYFVELCKCLGLIHRMTDTISRLIEDGQQFDAIRLACDFNFTDKYPPLTIMKEYVEKAKKTAEELLSKESDSRESLIQAMAKQVNSLILSWNAVDEYNIESVYRSSIKAEITQLLQKYANKRQSLEDTSSTTSCPHQQHKLQEQYQQQQQMLQEQHHQHRKPQEKQQQQQQKLHEEQDHHQQKAQEKQQQQLQNQQKVPEQEGLRQNSGKKWQNKKRWGKKRKQQQKAQEMKQHRFNKQPRLSHAGSFAHSPYNIRQGIRNHPLQQFSGIQRVPFEPCTRCPRFPVLYNRSQPRLA